MHHTSLAALAAVNGALHAGLVQPRRRRHSPARLKMVAHGTRRGPVPCRAASRAATRPPSFGPRWGARASPQSAAGPLSHWSPCGWECGAPTTVTRALHTPRPCSGLIRLYPVVATDPEPPAQRGDRLFPPQPRLNEPALLTHSARLLVWNNVLPMCTGLYPPRAYHIGPPVTAGERGFPHSRERR